MNDKEPEEYTEGYIAYSSGYKHQLRQGYKYLTDFRPREDIITPFIRLMKDGWMYVERGYACDGVSGPVIDRDTNMRGAFTHDPLYQLIREGHLKFEDWTKADDEFEKCLDEDGAWSMTIWIDMLGLKIAAGTAAKAENIRQIKYAPKKRGPQ